MYTDGLPIGTGRLAAMVFGGVPNQVDPYCPAGDLYIETTQDSVHSYRRELDLSTAQVSVRFKCRSRLVYDRCRRP